MVGVERRRVSKRSRKELCAAQVRSRVTTGGGWLLPSLLMIRASRDASSAQYSVLPLPPSGFWLSMVASGTALSFVAASGVQVLAQWSNGEMEYTGCNRRCRRRCRRPHRRHKARRPSHPNLPSVTVTVTYSMAVPVLLHCTNSTYCLSVRVAQRTDLTLSVMRRLDD